MLGLGLGEGTKFYWRVKKIHLNYYYYYYN
jgi:hypothetical protein